MLTSPDLLAKVKELGDVSKSDLVRCCGFFCSKGSGGRGRPSRQRTDATKVQFNGNLLVGQGLHRLARPQAGR